MAYLVELAARAARDLERNAAESESAARWYNGLQDAILALETHPMRSPVAPESSKRKRELRHLLYGKKPDVYRVIYQVDEKRQSVRVLHIRQAARRKSKSSALA
ncbi:MAG: type II toxin-antitoxin system RelE/ParE family toxin [Candidatus Korobacteraceae bacterium]